MTHAPQPQTNGGELDILMLSPRRRDADVACQLLRREGFECMVCGSLEELIRRAGQGVGTIAIDDDALGPDGFEKLLAALDEQPGWSDLPVIIFSTPARSRRIARVASKRNITVLDRPIHLPTFVTVIQAALESRRRQYEVRDLLQNLHTINSHLQQRTHRLQRLSLELSRAQHEERRRIAAEIHDYLAQLLVVGRLKLSQANQIPVSQKARALLREIDQVLDQSLTYTRTLVAELSPRVLDHAGLPAALTWLAEQMRHHGLDVQVSLPPTGVEALPLADDVAMAMYQSVRELLLNIVKHAQTERAKLSMAIDEATHLRITVSDEGRGFDGSAKLEGPPHAMTFGLFSIRERLAALGGRFDLDSAPGKGTRASLVLPISPVTDPGASSICPSAPFYAEERPGSGQIRVLLVDDHTMVRQGLRELLESGRPVALAKSGPRKRSQTATPRPAYPDIEIVGEVSNGIEALEAARALVPDVIVMDVHMPKLNGVVATREILRILPQVKVIGLSQDMDSSRAITEAGAFMHLQKASAADELYDAICAAARATTSPSHTT